MILNLINPSDRPLASESGSVVGHYVDVGDPVDATTISSSPFATFSADWGILGCTCLIEESDDRSTWTAMSGMSFAPSGYGVESTQFSYGVRTKRWVRATVEYDVLDSADRWGIAVVFGDLDPEAFAADDGSTYLGRFQQGQEIPLVLQCTDAEGSPDDPASIPQLSVFIDRGASGLQMIETVDMPADLRDVVVGLFRKPLFLGAAYSEAGRYLVLFKWLDSNNVPHVKTASFHILPNGSSDGSIIAMRYTSRPDANYLIWQCDSGRIIRKPNPR